MAFISGFIAVAISRGELFMDPQLAFRRVRRAPSKREYKLLSFDVFDTCLIRDFVSQESLWYLVGREIIGRLPGISSPTQFIRLRGRAENDARDRSGKEDITLADVYARLGSTWHWSPEQQRQAIAIEEELELRGLRLNPAATNLLARAHSVPVAYLSDTPHRAAFIRNCLDAQSLPSGEVLSSGDLGLRKGTGSLFREACKRFGVSRGQILHIGNNLEADGAGSAVAGVAFASMLDANPTRYEVTLDSATKESESGGLLGAVLAGASRDFRLASGGQSSADLVSVVSGVAGPVILAAVAWTLLSAQRDNIDTLYFVARDGEILLAVALLLQQELGLAAKIECRYLYGSRQAWHLPALSLKLDMDPAATLRAHLVRSNKDTLRGLLATLDITAEELAAVAPAATPDVLPDTRLDDHVTVIIDALVSSPEFQSLALERAKKAHEVTAAYLAQEEMFSGGRVGLVDLGWHGAASASLVTIAEDQGTDVLCYFAGGLCGPKAQAAPDDSQAFLIDNRIEEPEVRPILVALLEAFCAGSGGSTLGYMVADGKYVPRVAPGEGVAVSWGLRDYQALVYSFTTSVCRTLAKFEWTITVDEVNALRPYLLTNLCALWNYPTYGEAEQWGAFPFESENGSDLLGRVLTTQDLGDYLLHRFLVRHLNSDKKPPSAGLWTRAAIARTVGGKRFTDPLALLQAMSQPRRLGLRAKVRNRLARRPKVQLADVDVRNSEVIVRQ